MKQRRQRLLRKSLDLSEAILKNGDYYVPDTDWTIHGGKTLREETKHYARGEKVSVEEFLNASNNIERKAYHLQSIKIETADGHAIDNNVSISMSRSDAVSIDTISQLFDLVKQNDKNFNPKPASKVVNEDGTPRTVYHGTNTDFWTFDKGRLGSGNDQYGAGFYFASEKASAESYGNRVVEAYLDMKNPYEFSVNDESPNLIALGRSQPLTEEQTYEVLKRIPNIYDDEESILGDYYEEYWENGAQDWMIRDLAANEFNRNIGELDAGLFRDFPNELHEALRDVTGHDGILLKFKDGSEFYVPWFANQIKSATDNIGTFDTANDDIRFQSKAFDKSEEKEYNNIIENNSQEGDNYGKDFRDLQARSKRLSPEHIALFHRGDRQLDEGVRTRISGIFRRRLEAECGRLYYGSQVLRNHKANTNIKIFSGVAAETFHDIFEIVQKYLRCGDYVE